MHFFAGLRSTVATRWILWIWDWVQSRQSHLILLTFLGNLRNGTAPCPVDLETCLIKVILLKHGTDTGTFASASRAKDN